MGLRSLKSTIPDGPILRDIAPPPSDIGAQISTQISVAAASLSTSVMNDIFSQDATLGVAISSQFANRSII